MIRTFRRNAFIINSTTKFTSSTDKAKVSGYPLIPLVKTVKTINWSRLHPGPWDKCTWLMKQLSYQDLRTRFFSSSVSMTRLPKLQNGSIITHWIKWVRYFSLRVTSEFRWPQLSTFTFISLILKRTCQLWKTWCSISCIALKSYLVKGCAIALLIYQMKSHLASTRESSNTHSCPRSVKKTSVTHLAWWLHQWMHF